jgi:UDP-galactopyranose mutase
VPTNDVVIIGGGVSGLGFAYHAARAGRAVHLIEDQPRAGGCVDTRTSADGFWIELGAHTCYNSYGAFIELLEGLDLLGELQPRGKPVLRLLEGDAILPGQNLGALLRRMNLWELVRCLPRMFWTSQDGQTVRSYYSRIVGERNYDRALGPMLSAVPSQRADGFPADMLFKKRPRRKDILRSFTLKGGLGVVADRILRLPGVTISTGRAAATVERDGAGFVVTLTDGERISAELVAIATPPRAAARLLSQILPAVAGSLSQLGEATVDSLGVVVRADQVARVPYSTFLIPAGPAASAGPSASAGPAGRSGGGGDIFHSVVTRDVVPDPSWRGFVFHFQPGHAEDVKLARAGALLGIPPADFAHVTGRRTVLPSPALGHRDVIARLDAALAAEPIAVTGNWFAGLAIEDCVLRSRAEWQRVAGSPQAARATARAS